MDAPEVDATDARASTTGGGLRRAVRIVVRSLLVLLALLAIGWGSLALAVDGLGRAAALFYAVASLGLLVLHPRRLNRLACAFLFVLVLGWWLCIEPRNDRRWLPDVSMLSTMQVEGERLTVSNLRNFEYRSEQDFTPRWEERTFDLARVAGVDLLVCDWGDPLIVHTILSFQFEGGTPLAVSIETRKEEGEEYSALHGFFRQFELYYAVGDERDLIGVRTRVRGERVRLYRLAMDPARARDLLLVYARRINELAADPAWYNAITANCTTSIRLHAVELGIERPFDWRMLINGRGEELLYSRAMVSTSLPFEDLRARSDVTDEANAARESADFSEAIRRGLPARP